jgi:hypothetical protein
MACFGRAVWGIFSLLSCGPAVASNPEVLFALGPKARITGVIWRGTPGRPGVTSPTWAGRAWMTLPSSSLPGAAWRQEASLEEPRKLSSAGRGGGSGAHSPLPPVES